MTPTALSPIPATAGSAGERAPAAAPAASTVWVLCERRHFRDPDGQAASVSALRGDLGFHLSAHEAAQVAASHNVHLYVEHDRFNAQRHRENAAANRAFQHAVAEHRAIEEAGLRPSRPTPQAPREKAPLSLDQFLAYRASHGSYVVIEAVQILAATDRTATDTEAVA